jgi:hypothetical protein
VSAPHIDGRPVRVVIRNVRISAASAIDARRLADTIVPAMERAFAGLGRILPQQTTHSQRHADRVASQIADAVAERLRGRP